MKATPLSALFAIVIVGIMIEAVERQSKQAAYALVILLLLGVVTFNASKLTAQLAAINGILAAPSRYTSVGRKTRLNKKG